MNVSDTGWARKTCPLCGHENEMYFYKTPKGQRTYYHCPRISEGCGLVFYEDNRQERLVGEKELAAWLEGVAGWAPSS